MQRVRRAESNTLAILLLLTNIIARGVMGPKHATYAAILAKTHSAITAMTKSVMV